MNLDKIAVAFIIGILLAMSLGFVTYLVANNNMMKSWIFKLKKNEVDEQRTIKAEYVNIVPGIVVSASNGSASQAGSTNYINSKNVSSYPAYFALYSTPVQGNQIYVFKEEEWEGALSIGGTTLIYSKISVIYPEYDSMNWKKLISEAKAVMYIMAPNGSLIDIALNVPQGSNVTAFSLYGVLQLKNYTVTVYNNSEYVSLVYVTGNVDHETVVILPVLLNDSTIFVYVIDIKP